MGQTEMILFLVLMSLVVMIFIAGIVLFIIQYRKRKILHEKEKEEIEKQHRLDLLNTQLQIQQQTMQFIGQEIHDSVAQKLTLASIYTQRMEFDNGVPAIKDKLGAVSKIVNDSLLELRQISKDLTDTKLQGADLQELILMECDLVNASGICIVNFECNERPVINIATKSSLFRIIQEFIQNSMKHAACRNIRIGLHFSGTALDMYLEDDGKGFDIEKEQHKGIGLNNIRRRIQLLHGSYSLHSAPDKGVQLQLKVPVNTINS